jgi:hypothetical protein
MPNSGVVHYEAGANEAGANIDATGFGGIAAVHRLVTRLGLVERINEDLQLLKVHLPHHESDHDADVGDQRGAPAAVGAAGP